MILKCSSCTSEVVSNLLVCVTKFSHSQFRVSAYGHLSPEFTRTGIRQSCSFSPFLNNFLIAIVLEMALYSCQYSDIDLCSDMDLSELEQADRTVLLSEDAGRLQALPECLKGCICDAFHTFEVSNADAGLD